MPTQSNLSTWGRVLSPTCLACGHGIQSLLHVLNSCKQALNSYTWRHDNVLLKIRNFIKMHVLRDEFEINCDVVTDVEGTSIVLNESQNTAS